MADAPWRDDCTLPSESATFENHQEKHTPQRTHHTETKNPEKSNSINEFQKPCVSNMESPQKTILGEGTQVLENKNDMRDNLIASSQPCVLSTSLGPADQWIKKTSEQPSSSQTVSHAQHGGDPRQDSRAGRGASHVMEETSTPSTPPRAEGGTWLRHDLEEGHVQSQPALQEERPLEEVPHRGIGSDHHPQRDDPSASLHGGEGHSFGHSSHGTGSHGLGEAQSMHLHGSGQQGPSVRQLVSHHLQGGEHVLEDDPLFEMDQSRTSSHQHHEEASCGQGQSLHHGLPVRQQPLQCGGHASALQRILRLRRHQNPGRESGQFGGADPRTASPAGSDQKGLQHGHFGGEEPEDGESEVRESESSVKHTLSSKNWQGIKNKMFRGFESDWEALVMDGRLRLLEVCCSPDSVLTSTCETKFGAGSALRVSHLNGGDIETNEGRKHVKHLISEHRPQVVWLSPECGPYSPMQHLNMKTEKQRKDLQEKRAHAKLQYEGACELAMYTMSLGLDFVIELSERCEAWKMPCFVDLQKRTGACFGVCKGCQVGLKGSDGYLLGKGWKMLGSNHGLMRHMTLKCTTNHVHGKCEGSAACRASAFYTPAFAKRVIEHLQAGETMGEITKELMDGTDMQGHDRSMCHHKHVGSCEGEVLGTTEENPQKWRPQKEGTNHADVA